MTMENKLSPRRAEFSERALAFAVDGGVFAAAWALFLKASAPDLELALNPRATGTGLIVAGLFLLYQAFFSSEGRVSLGKRLFGLRVVDAGDRPLDLVSAIVRSLGYLFSQFFTAGFLWALFDADGRALHDLPAGSRVVALAPLRGARAFATRMSAAALMIAFAGAWGWQNIYGPRYHRILTVASARNGLNEFAQLQESYKREHGRYAENMFALSTESVDPQGFLRGAVALYVNGHVAITADRDHYAIAARANDVDRTLVAVSR
jgi:uncharacterized RDD family membrane protein YckC